MSDTMSSKVLIWDLPVRVFHWSFALAFTGAYALGESERWRDVHVALGYAVLLLVAFRLLWGLLGTRHARFRSFAYTPAEAWRYLKGLLQGRTAHYAGHNPAGSWAIYALLGLGLATGVSGWLRYEDVGGEALEDLHEILANAWLGLVVAHVAAVIVSSALHRENLPRSMLTGYRLGLPGEAAAGPRTAVGVGLLLATVALVAGLLLRGPADGRGAPDATVAAQSEMARPAHRDDD